MSAVPQPTAVSDFFDADAANWDAYYERQDVFSFIHQLRRRLALAWVDDLGLPAGARVLEVGCGTGLFALALARRGLRVTAVDSAANMLTRAAANAAAAGMGDRLRLLRADAGELGLPSGGFDLVVALGVVPWVPRPREALAEWVRVLAPGGRLVANCDNRRRLAVLLDVRYTPALAGLRAAARRVRGRPVEPAAAGGAATTIRHSPPEFDALLAGLGAPVERGVTFGFGPFTVVGREALPGRAGVLAHRALQRLADRRVPGLRGTGAQYLVQAARRRAAG